MASSISLSPITFRFLRAASKAASFKTFSRSAPEKPAVFLAIILKSTSSANFFFLE